MDALGQLKDLARASSLATDNAATFRDVSHKLAQRMEAPYVKANLSPDALSTVLIGADLAAVSVLFVLFQSIWLTLLTSPESANLDVFDTILLYRSKWGAFVGGLWVFVPTMLTMYLFPKDPAYFGSFIALFFVVRVFLRTIDIRKKLFSTFPAYTPPPTVAVAPAPKSVAAQAPVAPAPAPVVTTPAAAENPPPVAAPAVAPDATTTPASRVAQAASPSGTNLVAALPVPTASTPSNKEVKEKIGNDDEEDGEGGDDAGPRVDL